MCKLDLTDKALLKERSIRSIQKTRLKIWKICDIKKIQMEVAIWRKYSLVTLIKARLRKDSRLLSQKINDIFILCEWDHLQSREKRYSQMEANRVSMDELEVWLTLRHLRRKIYHVLLQSKLNISLILSQDPLCLIEDRSLVSWNTIIDRLLN